MITIHHLLKCIDKEAEYVLCKINVSFLKLWFYWYTDAHVGNQTKCLLETKIRNNCTKKFCISFYRITGCELVADYWSYNGAPQLKKRNYFKMDGKDEQANDTRQAEKRDAKKNNVGRSKRNNVSHFLYLLRCINKSNNRGKKRILLIIALILITITSCYDFPCSNEGYLVYFAGNSVTVCLHIFVFCWALFDFQHSWSL